MSVEFGRRSTLTRSTRLVTPEGVRRRLERLGPIFVKAGQYLALRPDLIDAEYCAEFLRLADRVRPFPFAQVREIIAEDLGGAPE